MRCFLLLFVSLLAVLLALANGQSNKCLRPCGRNIDERCGQYANGKTQTFVNPCVMQIEACNAGQAVKELYRGPCKK